MIEIVFQDQDPSQRIEQALQASVLAVFAQQKLDSASEVSILISGDQMLKELNKEHRGEDKATDVLSFPNEGNNPESLAPYLGDIAISFEKAKVQAESAGHSLLAEMQLLCVHGMLHLLGYDHGNPNQEETMWAAQNAILDDLGVEMDRERIGED